MDLTLFPFDRQVCKLSFESCSFVIYDELASFNSCIKISSSSVAYVSIVSDGYPVIDVIYRWHGASPVQLGNIRLPDFEVGIICL